MTYYYKYLKYKNKYYKQSLIFEKKYIEYSGRKLLLDLIKVNLVNTCYLVKKDDIYYLYIDNTNSKTGDCKNKNKIEFNWNNYKNYLTSNRKTVIYNTRVLIINELLNHIFNNFSKCKKYNQQICVYNSSGSTSIDASLESDYDLTLNGNYAISEIIEIFNSIFEKEFGKTSFEIFDTNLYGYSFIIPKNSSKNNKLWSQIDNNLDYEIVTEEIKSKSQDEWAYLRLLSFYNNSINDILRLDDNELNNKYNNNNINTISIKDKQNKYIKQMKKFENLIIDNNEINDDTNINNIKNNIIDTLSNMNYYGDETYFTQGAFQHVVGLMYYKTQSINIKKKLFKKTYYLIHSMIENMAYFIHAYYKHNNDIIYAIKYYNRFINAYVWLELVSNNNNLIKLNDLDELTELIKLHIRNRDNDYIMSKQKLFNFNTNINNITEFKNNLIEHLNNLIITKIIKKDIINTIHMYLESLLILLNNVIIQFQDYTNFEIKLNNNIYHITTK